MKHKKKQNKFEKRKQQKLIKMKAKNKLKKLGLKKHETNMKGSIHPIRPLSYNPDLPNNDFLHDLKQSLGLLELDKVR